MNKYTFAYIMRDKDYNIIQNGRIVLDADSAEDARVIIMQNFEREWPADNVHDIELHEVATLQRTIIAP